MAGETNFQVGAGEQFTVTDEMFYEGPKGVGPENNWDEYYGTFNYYWDHETYSVTLNSFGEELDSFEFTVEWDDGALYQQVAWP